MPPAKTISDAEQRARDLADAVSLRYVSDQVAGIIREKKGRGFSYRRNGKRVADDATLERIRKLVIPPAWTAVWICPDPRGHLQATGIDAAGRKQYKYHPHWVASRNLTKYQSLYDFGKKLPRIRLQVSKDLLGRRLSERKVLATIVRLMEKTCIRIGNGEYERRYGSYGLTTLKDNHVKLENGKMYFAFRGKKGVFRKVSIESRKLANAVMRCRDIPGKELFQYYDENGERQPVDSGMVNAYIREVAGAEFSAKDFRTWAGTVSMLEALAEMGEARNKTHARSNIVRALEAVSGKLGNTKAVCKKYYVHPLIIELYEQGRLVSGNVHPKGTNGREGIDMSAEELRLMKLLKAAGRPVFDANTRAGVDKDTQVRPSD